MAEELVVNSDGLSAIWAKIKERITSAVSNKRNAIGGTINSANSADDFNNYTTAGCYKVQGASWAMKNYPSGSLSYGVLVVERSETGNENRILQKYYSDYYGNTSNGVFVRMVNAGVWRSWLRQYATGDVVEQAYGTRGYNCYRDNKERMVEIGYIPIPYTAYLQQNILFSLKGTMTAFNQEEVLFGVLATSQNSQCVATAYLTQVAGSSKQSAYLYAELVQPTANANGALYLYFDGSRNAWESYNFTIISADCSFNLTRKNHSIYPVYGGSAKGMSVKGYADSARADADNNTISTTYQKINAVLELNDSNLATYGWTAAAEILSGIPNTINTIVVNTTSLIKIGAVQVTGVFNGKRMAILGNFAPSERYTTTEGRFSQYLYDHRCGTVYSSGDGLQAVRGYDGFIQDTYEDFIYFNGTWYSKGY